MEKSLAEIRDDFMVSCLERRLASPPFLYNITLSDAVPDEPDEIVKINMYHGMFYNVGAAWSMYELLNGENPTEEWLSTEGKKWFRPMPSSRRTANRDMDIVRVFEDVHANLDWLADRAFATESHFDYMQDIKTIFSFGDYFAIRAAWGILRKLRPELKMDFTPISKQTDRPFRILYPGVRQTQDTSQALIDDFGLEWWEMATFLCEFKQMLQGTAYPTMNADKDLEKIALVAHLGMDVEPLWEARAGVLPNWALGEKNGWMMARRELLPLYKRKGVIYTDRPEGVELE